MGYILFLCFRFLGCCFHFHFVAYHSFKYSITYVCSYANAFILPFYFNRRHFNALSHSRDSAFRHESEFLMENNKNIIQKVSLHFGKFLHIIRKWKRCHTHDCAVRSKWNVFFFTYLSYIVYSFKMDGFISTRWERDFWCRTLKERFHVEHMTFSWVIQF